MTIAVFAGHSLYPEDWSAIEESLLLEQRRNAASIPALGAYQLQVVRGDQIPPGNVVAHSISVYFVGSCAYSPVTLFEGHFSAGVLGWVERRRGKIQPFIHVQCDHLLQLLSPRITGMNREQQRHVISVAIARVILHEWNHIETQSSNHVERGFTRSSVTADDLMPEPDSLAKSVRAKHGSRVIATP